MSDSIPIVVYHVAAIGNYREVVREHMLLLRDCGLATALAGAGEAVRLTHVGGDLEWILEEAARQDVPIAAIRSDPNVDHYETFAMLEIERMAKEELVQRPILYFHTKGVSAPHSRNKRAWRHTMNYHVVWRWRENVRYLDSGYDACGFNFWFTRGENHFSGTFWMASAEWIRKLPPFVQYHHSKNLVRYSCELWIGATPGIRAMSHGCNDEATWESEDYDYGRWGPRGADPRATDVTVTWVTAATPSYSGDLSRIVSSAALLGPGHHFHAILLSGDTPWRHTLKLSILRDMAASIRTTHVMWVDADCEFLCPLLPRDICDPNRPLTAVRHLAYDRPRTHLPDRLRHMVVNNDPCYRQACLFGGRVAEVAALIDRLRWMGPAGEGYDEYGLNIEWDALGPERVLTLPCRYATPANWAPLPSEYRTSYESRAGGAARILHHNREIGG